MGKKGEETKRLIREKAISLFAQKGFKNVTMKDICCETGLSGADCTGITTAHGKSSQKSSMS